MAPLDTRKVWYQALILLHATTGYQESVTPVIILLYATTGYQESVILAIILSYAPTGYQEKQNIQPKGNKEYEWRESATSSDWSESNTCRKQQLEIRSQFVLAILSAKGKEDWLCLEWTAQEHQRPLKKGKVYKKLLNPVPHVSSLANSTLSFVSQI